MALLEQIRQRSDIPIRCLMRPRFGDFLYTPEEIQLMELQIPRLASAGANGFVIGCLTPEGRLDRRSMERLVNAAGGRGLDPSIGLRRKPGTLQKPWLTPLAWESTPSSPAVRPPIAGPGGNVWASSWSPALPWK